MGWEHVIPDFISKINKSIIKSNNNEEITLEIQGNGTETRAFIYIDDFAEGLIKVYEKGSNLGIYNIGTDSEITIADLAKKIGTNFKKDIIIRSGDIQKGSTNRRCPDISKLKSLGFLPKITLDEGIKYTTNWYVENIGKSKSK